MILDHTGVDAALSALGEHLSFDDAKPVELVVCGGSALQALGLIHRATRDVDVLALFEGIMDGRPNLVPAEPMPDAVARAAKVVARDLGLPDDWLNSGPTDLLSQGLPDGFLDRLHRKGYGARLTVHFVGRFDQICFKLYAAINGGSARHLSDLKALSASETEMLTAARWCLTQDASEVFPAIVGSFLEKTGYQNVAAQLGLHNQE